MQTLADRLSGVGLQSLGIQYRKHLKSLFQVADGPPEGNGLRFGNT